MNLKLLGARVGLSASAIVLALLAGAALLHFSGYPILEAYSRLFQGGLGLNTSWQPGEALVNRPVRLGNMLNEASLLILVAVALAIPLWCGMINLGAEGQLLMGGLGAVLAALFIPLLHPFLHIPLVFLSGAAFGGLWAALAGWLRVYRGLNEIITTIMLNFVAFWFVSYLTQGPLKDTGSIIGYPWTREIPASLKLPFIWNEGRVLVTLLVTVLVVVAAYILLRYTRLGFQMRAAGLEPGTSAFVGFNVGRLQIASMGFSGALSGIAGAALLLGLQYRLSDAFASNYGFDAVAVVLVGLGHPVGIAAAGVVFGILRTGSEAMEVSAGVPKSLGVLLQALALVFLMIAQGKALSAWWRKLRTRRSFHDHAHPADRSQS
jgi:simple sugar transport system permease protein